MNSTLRLYERDGTANPATIFDLIVGSGAEPRQTKALAYVLSESEWLLSRLLKVEAIARTIRDVSKSRKFDQAIIDAEMIGVTRSGNVRADIVIRLFNRGVPAIAVMIEAKSAAKAGSSDGAVIEQVQRYLSEADFPALRGWPVAPVALTRTARILQGIASITWNELRELVFKGKDNGPLLAEFGRFLTKTGGDMQFYEEEVLSVPAGNTAHIVDTTFVHACPDTKGYNYKMPLRIAFRQSQGGAMRRLHKVREVFSFDPLNDASRQAALERSLSDDERNRLIAYLEARDRGFKWGVKGEPFRFYILDPDDVIDLPHEPKPLKSSQGHIYYRLCDILDRDREIIPPAQQSR